MIRTDYIFITLFALTLIFTACRQDGMVTNETELTVQENENFTLITNSSLVENFRKNRSAELSEEFEIVDVYRTEKNDRNYLQIEIAHHSCNPEVRIIWDGNVAESHPPQTFLFIQLLDEQECANGIDPGKQEKRISVNLNELFGDEYTAKYAAIGVFNTSKKSLDNDHLDEPVDSSGGL